MERPARVALLSRVLPTPVRGVLVAAVALAVVAAGRPAAAQVTQDQALHMAFAGVDSVERHTAYLDDAQVARASALAGDDVDVDARVVTYYVAVKGGLFQGVAYFDAHRVRTEPEVLMVVVGTDGRIRRVEVVRFSEPPDYRPQDGWLDLFQGHELGDGLSLKGDIPRMTGASLTSEAVTRATRRVLALHAVIAPFGGGGRP